MKEGTAQMNPAIDGFTIKASPDPTSTSSDDIEEVDFDFEGYQVVRGEFFSHIYEPSITFCNNKVYVNTTCLKKVPDFDYVQILVNPNEKKLAVRPCQEDERDSFRWCSASKKRTPKQITCRVFFAKVITLMSWNPSYRYKILGKLIRSNNERLLIFDLQSFETYTRTVKKDGKVNNSRIPIFPEEWKNQFGIPYQEHRKSLQVGIFDGYAVFGLQQDPKKKRKKESEDPNHDQLPSPGVPSNTPDRSKEKQDQDS